MPRTVATTRSAKSELHPTPPAHAAVKREEDNEEETLPLTELDDPGQQQQRIDSRGRGRRPPSYSALPEQHRHHDCHHDDQHQVPPSGNSWWQRSGFQQRLQQGHLCYSGALIPCMMVITIILILLATKYEHLAEAAELALNATLLIVKTKAVH